ncbi:MAG: hypothetical protein ACTHKZ_01925 [Lysobacteraceae bacterium]
MTRLLLAGLLAGVAFAASAQSTGATQSTRSVGSTVEPTSPSDVHSEGVARDVRDHTCLRETGSLITTSQNQRTLRTAQRSGQPTVEVKCANFGRAYTQEDIRNTGASGLADALRRLDPSVR